MGAAIAAVANSAAAGAGVRAEMSLAAHVAGQTICCSWSGGKDSCLALYRTLAASGRLACLVTMFTEDGQRSRSHGLAREVLEAQAASMGVPLLSAAATWDEYEPRFVELLRAAVQRGATA